MYIYIVLIVVSFVSPIKIFMYKYMRIKERNSSSGSLY